MSQGAGTCPRCGGHKTVVRKTKHEGAKTIRSHMCKQAACGHRWTTVQEVARYVGWVPI